MVLKVLGSESAGNCYTLETDAEVLILEARIRLQYVKKALDYDLSKVLGCLVTHSHGDHAKCARDYMRCGIDIYASQETLEAKYLDGHRAKVYTETPFKVGSFKVKAFRVPHGVPCFGFLISHPESGLILFITDAAYIPYQFNNLNQILIEANYEDGLLTSDRAVGHHMSLDTCLEFLEKNEMGHVRNVVLLHLSSGNSDAKSFLQSVKEIAPRAEVNIADRGLEIVLNKFPF